MSPEENRVTVSGSGWEAEAGFKILDAAGPTADTASWLGSRQLRPGLWEGSGKGVAVWSGLEEKQECISALVTHRHSSRVTAGSSVL